MANDPVSKPTASRLMRLILGSEVLRIRREMRDAAVRHARERAALDAWVIEVTHYFEVGSEIDAY